jgi:hypothetical protein
MSPVEASLHRKGMWPWASPAVALATAAVLWVLGSPSPAQADGASEQVTLVCEAAYMPTRSVWRRSVVIEYNDQRVLNVRIDGLKVFSFAVEGTLIMTGLDNERIQIDTATQIWTSDFRGLANARGHCERAL